jgi:protein involved in polysaccharide export with SLBB domain
MTDVLLARRSHTDRASLPPTGPRWFGYPGQCGWLLLLIGLVLPSMLAGQTARAGASRVELETLRDFARAGSVKISSTELMEVERRLREGDLSIGDQIMLEVTGVPSLNGTFTVTPGPSLDLPDIPTISLAGILRSELEEHVTENLSQYVRNPEVRATTLMRIAMFGAVGRPGFYHLSPNLTLSDAIMNAGGPIATADMGKVVIRRADEEIHGKKEVAQAITAGTTLDRMNLHGGDAVDIGTTSGAFIGKIGRVILVLGGLAASILSINALLGN